MLELFKLILPVHIRPITKFEVVRNNQSCTYFSTQRINWLNSKKFLLFDKVGLHGASYPAEQAIYYNLFQFETPIQHCRKTAVIFKGKFSFFPISFPPLEITTSCSFGQCCILLSFCKPLIAYFRMNVILKSNIVEPLVIFYYILDCLLYYCNKVES